jgi:hypothetical protein
MDKIISIAICLFIVILAPFTGILAYNSYVETAYRNTITGNYTYTCTITTDAPLYNVTLFIPVPADGTGNSPMVSAFSSGTMSGVPAAWEPTLFDTGKATMIKLVTPAIIPPAGTTTSHPSTITFSSETTLRSAIETKDPVGRGVMFRPVQALTGTACPMGPAENSTRCSVYTTSLYADYSTAADARVTITSAVTGRNSWKIFGPRSNEYHTEISIAMPGETHGWVVPEGKLSSGTGSYDAPVVS